MSPKAFDYAHDLQYGDHELILLESPLKDQFMITSKTIEKIPCGSSKR
jgi:hypothetical protein